MLFAGADLTDTGIRKCTFEQRVIVATRLKTEDARPDVGRYKFSIAGVHG